MKTIVIGGGAAGCMAAITAANKGDDVLLLERNDKIGRKVMITGKGRCNVTNDCDDIRRLIANVPGNGSFLYSAFSRFMPLDTMEFFESRGVRLKIERGNRVFPVSDKSSDIVDCLYRTLNRSEVRREKAKIVSLTLNDLGEIDFCTDDTGNNYSADKFILATGGASYSGTGSDGIGYELARSVGHTITPIRASLCPLNSDDEWTHDLQGLSLKNTGLKLFEDGKVIYEDLGEMLFTHFGVSGPMILSASAHIRHIDTKKYKISLDLKPGLSDEMLDRRLLRDFSENENKKILNSLSALLPSKMIPTAIVLSKIHPETVVNQITHEQRMSLVRQLKNMEFTVSSLRPVEEAIITAGGVSTKEIDPKTMRSKIVDNLYFAGEIIDVDAYTGGFNLQIAFSTGVAAGT